MRVLISIFLLLQVQFIEAQEVRAQVVDASSRKPIPYANIIFSENRGLVTNEEGFFGYNPEDQKIPDTIQISSMGYEMLNVSPEKISGGIIYLKPASIELREVFLSNRDLSAKEIIEKVLEEVPNNYNFDHTKKRVFLRESNTNFVRKFNMEVDKSTIAGIDQNLMNRISSQIPKVSDSYKEVLADLYGNYDGQKLKIIKAANLHNPQSNQTLDQLTKHLETLFKNNLKDKSYLKVRSGIIGVKVDADELQDELVVSAEKKEKTPEEIEKTKLESRKSLNSSTSSKVKRLMNGMFWKEDLTFNLFEKSGKYEFNHNGFAYINNEPVYVIEFKPKRRADFKGKLYVNTVDYGVHRLEYENVKPLKKFRLFGISTADDVYRGKMIFRKDDSGKYNLSYMERETGETFGLDRPLTIIEKNKHVPGRNKLNELDLDLDLRMSQVQKLQLVVFENVNLPAGAFDDVAAASTDFDYQTFKAYNPEFWNGYNIMEPNAAIKSFVALENEETQL